ncbi:hypothetical protein NECAME_12296 [Necator americanus]|uniref:SXP/RAL-2 family protein Ani s 5-like cation-binding domain-containing protein n=1 Tax=Necator americanus TaxID=51031 RepID=W2T0R2_NECAM|nr:hypothetical protein NECAME_12296 [Necator americanus]ETN75595.1 hypothetical protein NECAME_12296 [Necator americanus]
MKTRILTVVIFAAVFVSAYNDDHWIRGRRRHGQHGHHGHHRHFPPFLLNVTKEAKKEYYKIINNSTAIIGQQMEEIRKWAERNNITDQVKKFEEDMKTHKEEVKKNVTDLLALLPVIHNEFSEIVENENQTRFEMREAIEKLREKNRAAFDTMLFGAGEIVHRGRRVERHQRSHDWHYHYHKF